MVIFQEEWYKDKDYNFTDEINVSNFWEIGLSVLLFSGKYIINAS